MNKYLAPAVLTSLSLLLSVSPVQAQTAPAAPAAPAAAAKPMVVKVNLNEWTMGMSDMKVKGPVSFEVVNDGKFPHALAIEGKIGDQSFELSTGWLKAGEKTTLTVNLPAGTYNAYCPVGEHESKGMKSDLTFE
jgi:uncharacterized cupredoxin-like copper-binding protein